MEPVAKLFADLSLRSTGFKKGVGEAINETRRLNKEMSKTFGRKTNNNVREVTRNLEKMTWAARGGVKDIMRVVSGILISQTFYTLLRELRSSVAAMHEFTKATERSRIAFGLLLDDAEKGVRLTRAVERFAATTPATMVQSKQMAETLLSLGFQAESLLPVMNSILDASVIGGGTEEVLVGITRALGDIQAKGRLDALHIRRFVAARVPIFEILREELGLTEEQMKRIGALDIPAETAIDAILRGIDKRFGGAAEMLGTTWDARMAQIKDNLAMISRVAYESTYDSLKEGLDGLRDWLMDLRDTAERLGPGGIFEAIIPEKYHASIRVIVASFNSLRKSIVRLHVALRPARQALNELFIKTLAFAAPIIAGLVDVLSRLFYLITNKIPLVSQLSRVIGTLLIAYAAGAAVMFLAKAIKSLFIIKWIISLVGLLKVTLIKLGAVAGVVAAVIGGPMTAVLFVAAGALIYLAGTSKTAAAWLDALMLRLAKLFGFNAEKLWVPTEDDFHFDDAEFGQDYLGGLEDIGEAFEDATGAGQGFKKFLASFDEVFQVPEPSGGGGGLDDLADLFDDLPDVSSPQIPPFELPDIPEMGTMASFEWPIEPLNWDELLPPFPGWPPVPPFIWPPILIPAPEFEPGWIPAFERDFERSFVPVLERARQWAADAVRDYLKEMRKFGIPIFIPAPNIAPGWNTLTDGLLEQMEKIFKGLDNAWGAATPKLNEFSERLRQVAEQGHGVFDGLLEGLRGISIAPDWGAVTHKVQDLRQGFQNAAEQVSTAVDAIKLKSLELGFSISAAIPTAIEKVLELGFSFGEVAIAAASVIPGVIDGVVDLAKQYGREAQKVIQSVKDIIESHKIEIPTISEVWSSMADAAKNIWENHKFEIGVLAAAVAAVGIGAFVGVPAGVAAALVPLGKKAGIAFAGMIPFIDFEVGKIPGLITEREGTMGERARSLVSRITESFSEVPERFQNSVLLLPGILESTRTGLSETATDLIEMIKETLFELIPSWEEIVNKLPEPLQAILGSMQTGAQELLSTLVTKFSELTPSWQDIVNQMPPILSSIIGPMSSLANTLASNVITGLSRIRTAISGIIGALDNMVSRAASAASTAAGHLSSAARSAAGAAREASNAAKDSVKAAAERIKATTKESEKNKTTSIIGGRAKGGIITSPEISWIGEAGPEVVIPLSGKNKMQPFVNLMLSQMSKSVRSAASTGKKHPMPAQTQQVEKQVTRTQQTQQTHKADAERLIQALENRHKEDNRPILYVGTLVADDRSLVELERRMDVIRAKENVRRGGHESKR